MLKCAGEQPTFTSCKSVIIFLSSLEAFEIIQTVKILSSPSLKLTHNTNIVTHPPELVQGTQHLLQLGHLLSGSSRLTIPIKVLGQLWTEGETCHR